MGSRCRTSKRKYFLTEVGYSLPEDANGIYGFRRRLVRFIKDKSISGYYPWGLKGTWSNLAGLFLCTYDFVVIHNYVSMML